MHLAVSPNALMLKLSRGPKPHWGHIFPKLLWFSCSPGRDDSFGVSHCPFLWVFRHTDQNVDFISRQSLGPWKNQTPTPETLFVVLRFCFLSCTPPFRPEVTFNTHLGTCTCKFWNPSLYFCERPLGRHRGHAEWHIWTQIFLGTCGAKTFNVFYL